jgi:hypothetical protein
MGTGFFIDAPPLFQKKFQKIQQKRKSQSNTHPQEPNKNKD